MPIALSNLDWMPLNIFLASLGLLFGLLFLYFKNKILKIVCAFLWILFLPNTIYLVTDLEHLSGQLSQTRSREDFIAVFIQYVLLFIFGVFTYLFGMYPLYKIFPRTHKAKRHSLFLPAAVILNILIAFGVVMGKDARTHSFYLFTHPIRVVHDLVTIATTPATLMVVAVFALLCNLIFFSFHKAAEKNFKLN